ncbi:hypothetical protein PsorP6_006717 [Peronosclerospora sorghi]|uniref:Uncharacterized protein n=1 Tax=Peronosclerospora sorghi TaxID=230839 RepID=A0ACC0W456_9STRA|nr:hypothetical protein PsorP6_006717 [Peronosclerospora sorghi]
MFVDHMKRAAEALTRNHSANKTERENDTETLPTKELSVGCSTDNMRRIRTLSSLGQSPDLLRA